jgi:aryl carrier-like protein
MIKKHLTWLSPLTVGVACLTTGLLAGYSIPRDRQAAGEKEQAVHVATARVEAKPPTSNQPKAKYAFTFPKTSPTTKKPATSGILQSVPPSGNQRARQEWLQSLAPEDLGKLLDSLCQSAGPAGLSGEEKGLVRSALQQWWRKDGDSLLAWLGQLPSGGAKNYLLSNLLQWLAGQDSQRAMALAESFKAQDPEWDSSRLLNQLLEKEARAAWEKPGVTAEEMLAIYSRAGRGNNCTGAHQNTYPLNFDYRKFLDGMVSLNRQDGKSPAIMPPDILDAWAKADPEAAIRWLVDYEKNKETNGTVPFVGWQNIVSGVIARSGPQAYHQWAAQIVTQSDAGLRDTVIRQSEEADLVGIVQQIGNPAQRDEVLASAIESDRWRRDKINLLTLISTPEARLEVIVDKLGSAWIEQRNADPAFWPRLGLTKEQVDAAVAKRDSR